MMNWYTAEVSVYPNPEYPFEKLYAVIYAESYMEVENFVFGSFEKTGLLVRDLTSIKKEYNDVVRDNESIGRFSVKVEYELMTEETVDLLFLVEADDEESAKEKALVHFLHDYQGLRCHGTEIIGDMPEVNMIADKMRIIGGTSVPNKGVNKFKF